MIKIPPYLKKGDLIGITCPGGYMAKEKVQTCIETLYQWGYRVKIGKTVGGGSATYFSGTDEERLEDLQQMLDDNQIRAILCGRGGYGTGRIIDRLDFNRFKKHPKWVIGFSDITVLHCHIHNNFNISTLHAPMAAAFNEEGYKNEYVLSLKRALSGKKIKYSCAPHPFNRTGLGSGPLVGGNLSLLVNLIGTPSDLKTRGKILFIEEVGEYLYSADRMIHHLKRSGKLERLAGLIIGGFTNMKDTERPFGESVQESIYHLIADYKYPVCMDFPVSHDKENYALKTGTAYQLQVTAKKVMLTEALF